MDCKWCNASNLNPRVEVHACENGHTFCSKCNNMHRKICPFCRKRTSLGGYKKDTRVTSLHNFASSIESLERTRRMRRNDKNSNTGIGTSNGAFALQPLTQTLSQLQLQSLSESLSQSLSQTQLQMLSQSLTQSLAESMSQSQLQTQIPLQSQSQLKFPISKPKKKKKYTEADLEPLVVDPKYSLDAYKMPLCTNSNKLNKSTTDSESVQPPDMSNAVEVTPLANEITSKASELLKTTIADKNTVKTSPIKVGTLLAPAKLSALQSNQKFEEIKTFEELEMEQQENELVYDDDNDWSDLMDYFNLDNKTELFSNLLDDGISQLGNCSFTSLTPMVENVVVDQADQLEKEFENLKLESVPKCEDLKNYWRSFSDAILKEIANYEEPPQPPADLVVVDQQVSEIERTNLYGIFMMFAIHEKKAQTLSVKDLEIVKNAGKKSEYENRYMKKLKNDNRYKSDAVQDNEIVYDVRSIKKKISDKLGRPVTPADVLQYFEDPDDDVDDDYVTHYYDTSENFYAKILTNISTDTSAKFDNEVVATGNFNKTEIVDANETAAAGEIAENNANLNEITINNVAIEESKLVRAINAAIFEDVERSILPSGNSSNEKKCKNRFYGTAYEKFYISTSTSNENFPSVYSPLSFPLLETLNVETNKTSIGKLVLKTADTEINNKVILNTVASDITVNCVHIENGGLTTDAEINNDTSPNTEEASDNTTNSPSIENGPLTTLDTETNNKFALKLKIENDDDDDEDDEDDDDVDDVSFPKFELSDNESDKISPILEIIDVNKMPYVIMQSTSAETTNASLSIVENTDNEVGETINLSVNEPKASKKDYFFTKKFLEIYHMVTKMINDFKMRDKNNEKRQKIKLTKTKSAVSLTSTCSNSKIIAASFEFLNEQLDNTSSTSNDRLVEITNICDENDISSNASKNFSKQSLREFYLQSYKNEVNCPDSFCIKKVLITELSNHFQQQHQALTTHLFRGQSRQFLLDPKLTYEGVHRIHLLCLVDKEKMPIVGLSARINLKDTIHCSLLAENCNFYMFWLAGIVPFAANNLIEIALMDFRNDDLVEIKKTRGNLYSFYASQRTEHIFRKATVLLLNEREIQDLLKKDPPYLHLKVTIH